MEKMMQYDPQKRPTASQCLEHDYFKDVISPVSNSIYGKSNKGFFNKANEINSNVRKSSAVSKRLESRKSKLESRGVNKNSFYKTREKNPDRLPSKPPANSYFNNPAKAGLPSIGKDSSKGFGGLAKRPLMGSGERNRSIPSGKNSNIINDGNSGGILGKYYKNNQGLAGAQDSTPVGLSKGYNPDSYGYYDGNKYNNEGGLSGVGGNSKISRKDSRKDSSKGIKPSLYGGHDYGGGLGISKYKNDENDEERFPSVTNKQALGSGSKKGGDHGSKEGSRSKLVSGGLGGFGGLKQYGAKPAAEKDSGTELPNLNKYSNAGGLGGLNKGGLQLGSGGLSKGGGLGRYNL